MYKYFFSCLICDKFCSNFMRACQLGITDVGIKAIISFISDLEPNQNNIERIKNLLLSSKNAKIDSYYANVSFESVEIVLSEV